MPKDSHLLPQHSQDLLRAARSGRVYKRPTPVEEEEVDIEGITADKVEKKDYELKGKGYTVKAWKPVPRHLEGPAIDYLAKRRKGLVTVDAKTASTGSVLTKATVKRYDAAGNEYVQDVVVPHGETVEGEVISQTTIVDPNATRLGDGLLTRTPPRRKGPPKRKAKGPGRGRRRKPIVATSAPQTLQTDGDAQNVEGGDGVVETNVSCISLSWTSGEDPNSRSRRAISRLRMRVIAYPRITKILKWLMVRHMVLMKRKGKRARRKTMMKKRELLTLRSHHPNVDDQILVRNKIHPP